MGALIESAKSTNSSIVVSDPFSGGGTVAIEAARRGVPVYAQDIHPWATLGVATALDAVDSVDLEEAAKRLLDKLDQECGKSYETTCPSHGPGATTVHVFWSRSAQCPDCETPVFLFPYGMVTKESRREDEIHGYFGCAACGAVTRHTLGRKRRSRCNECSRPLSLDNEPLLSGRQAKCVLATCGAEFGVFDGSRPRWKAVLAFRTCSVDGKPTSHFGQPTATEATLGISKSVPSALREPIPLGRETAILRRAGFETWQDALPARQLNVLLEASSIVGRMDVSDAVKARLRLAIAGSAEMSGFLSRWDRYHTKAFEAVANHRFPALGIGCETNPLALRGRGTLRKRLASSVAAAAWAEQTLPSGPATVRRSARRRVRVRADSPVVTTGSSERQSARAGSVDLALTDPPYFDAVQYSELASLHLAWARAVNLLPNTVATDFASEAIPHDRGPAAIKEYRALLSRVFEEIRRTLRPDGRLILTYHSTVGLAWWCLGDALASAGFSVSAIAVADAENADDHPKRGSRAFTKDLVIECVVASPDPDRIQVAHASDDEQDRELLAAGLAVAQGKSTSWGDFRERLVSNSTALEAPRIQSSETRFE